MWRTYVPPSRYEASKQVIVQVCLFPDSLVCLCLSYGCPGEIQVLAENSLPVITKACNAKQKPFPEFPRTIEDPKWAEMATKWKMELQQRPPDRCLFIDPETRSVLLLQTTFHPFVGVMFSVVSLPQLIKEENFLSRDSDNFPSSLCYLQDSERWFAFPLDPDFTWDETFLSSLL
jgi:hypothetical protein